MNYKYLMVVMILTGILDMMPMELLQGEYEAFMSGCLLHHPMCNRGSHPLVSESAEGPKMRAAGGLCDLLQGLPRKGGLMLPCWQTAIPVLHLPEETDGMCSLWESCESAYLFEPEIGREEL